MVFQDDWEPYRLISILLIICEASGFYTKCGLFLTRCTICHFSGPLNLARNSLSAFFFSFLQSKTPHLIFQSYIFITGIRYVQFILYKYKLHVLKQSSHIQTSIIRCDLACPKVKATSRPRSLSTREYMLSAGPPIHSYTLSRYFTPCVKCRDNLHCDHTIGRCYGRDMIGVYLQRISLGFLSKITQIQSPYTTTCEQKS